MLTLLCLFVFFLSLQRNYSLAASHPDNSEELLKAVRSVVLCLDALTSDLWLTPGHTPGEDDDPLRLLQREVC